jgi:hypothetical protein
VSEASTGAPPSAAAGDGPLGRPRGILFVILVTIVTLGIYHLYWSYKVFDELKQHTGEGIGGVLGLVIAIVVGIVNSFVLPSEIGRMYVRDGRAAPMSGWTGLWVLLPLVGWFVWIVKVQGAMNRYWESKGATASS